MAKYLVTGGAGFIGSHLVRALLARGDNVVVLDNLSTGRQENVTRGAKLVVGDILSRTIVNRLMQDVDGCFHLAAVASVQKSVEDWSGTHRINLTGTINLLDAARTRGVPMVYASSAAVYGNPHKVPTDEGVAKIPLTAYGADKYGCELHAHVAGVTFGVPSTGLRFFNVYGPGQDPSSPYSGVISIFADRMSKGLPIKIYGDGCQVRDFVHVEDVVRHLMAAINVASASAPVLNVCTGRPTSILELAKVMKQLLRSDSEIVHAEARAGDIRVSLGCARRATLALGVSADLEIGSGLGWIAGDARPALMAA